MRRATSAREVRLSAVHLDDAPIAEPGDPGSLAVPPVAPADRHADRLSRGLVLAFVLCLGFIGWLGVTGLGGAAAAGQGLFDHPADCGGG